MLKKIFAVVLVLMTLLCLSACENDKTDSSPSKNPEDYLYLVDECRNTEMTEAYKSGDYSSLDETSRKILEKCAEIISEYVTDDMTLAQKERVLHDYITANCTYDTDEWDERLVVSPKSSTPEGPLFEGKAICMGYTSTFQLFMDLIEVPCITIDKASAFSDYEDHAWNMVYLDGKWYHVDTTWDDPVPDTQTPKYSFFNVDDKLMSQKHHWDTELYPEAPEAMDSSLYK